MNFPFQTSFKKSTNPPPLCLTVLKTHFKLKIKACIDPECYCFYACIQVTDRLVCISAGTLSECMSKKLADHHLHTVALQFLATVFTEETKCRTEAITNSERSSPLLDILNGPPANQLCELLLQVRGWGARTIMRVSSVISCPFCP